MTNATEKQLESAGHYDSDSFEYVCDLCKKYRHKDLNIFLQHLSGENARSELLAIQRNMNKAILDVLAILKNKERN
jgi:hypothetical protein